MSKLVSVELETSLGAVYRFPDMDEASVTAVLHGLWRGEHLTYVNMSGACLVIPTRIVDVIRIDVVEKWRRG